MDNLKKRDKIVEFCKKHIAVHNYERVGHAVANLFGKDEDDKSIHQSVAATLENTGKYYIVKLENGDYNVFKKHIAWKERNWLWIAIASWIIGILTTILVAKVLSVLQEPTKEESNQSVLKQKDSVSLRK